MNVNALLCCFHPFSHWITYGLSLSRFNKENYLVQLLSQHCWNPNVLITSITAMSYLKGAGQHPDHLPCRRRAGRLQVNPEVGFPRDGASPSSGCQRTHRRLAQKRVGWGRWWYRDGEGDATAPVYLFSGKSTSRNEERDPVPLGFVCS